MGDLKLNLQKMMQAKDTSVSALTKGIEFLFKKNNVEYVKGTGAFADEHTVKVNLVDGGETHVRGKNILIATGSESTPFPGLTIDEKKVITSTGAIALKEVPKKMIVIGGGIIGLEMVCGPRCLPQCPFTNTSHRALSGHDSELRSPWLSSSAKLVAPAWTRKSPKRRKKSCNAKA